jgi:hypothetical protein
MREAIPTCENRIYRTHIPLDGASAMWDVPLGGLHKADPRRAEPGVLECLAGLAVIRWIFRPAP